MTQELYQKALRYATKLIGDYSPAYNDAHDLLHDGWLKCQDEDFLFLGVKQAYYDKLKSQYITIGYDSRNSIKGEVVRKIFTEINPTGSEFGDRSIDIEVNDKYDCGDVSIFFSSLGEFDKKVLNLKIEGYQNQEVEQILERSNPIITSSIKRIKEKMHTNSPFNGSRLKIVKRVKRKDFEENKEKYLEEYGKEGDWDKNEVFEQMPSKEDPSIGILIKEKSSD